MSEQAVVTRFAPSPTGYLHVGGARTALFNWLLARHTGGRFLLRIEDTDLARSTEQACRALLEDLRWLGLHWDNPQIMYQSRRLEVYNRVIDELISRGLAYRAYETPEELDAMRREAEARREVFIYRRRALSDEQVRRYEAEGRPAVVRFAMPVREYRFTDVILGKEVVLPAGQVQDFVIRKADGMPTYHFAVVVDDAEMGITHVLRGQEHLLNTVNHIALQEALGYRRPVYGHLPIILNMDGSKMGKRDRDRKIRHHAHLWLKARRGAAPDLAAACGLPAERVAAWLDDETRQLDVDEQKRVMEAVGLTESDLPEILVHDFRRNGYLPEVLLNFLALLGWNPGGDRERMTIEEMIRLFDLKDVGRANARFNREKLLAFNTEGCAAASPQRLVAAMRDYLAANPDSPLQQADDTALERIITMKPGFRTLRELDVVSRFLFMPDEGICYDREAVDKVLRKHDGQGIAVLRDMHTILAGVEDWSAAALQAVINDYCAGRSLPLGKVAQPLRVAVCGTTVSPPIFESLAFLGRQRTLARIARCLSLL